MQKALQYASKKGILYTIVLGAEEQKEKKYICKNMHTGDQQKINYIQK